MPESLSFSAITLAAAFGAGVLSFVSPCVLPLVPAYLAFLAGAAGGQEQGFRGRAIRGSLFFALGLALTFTLLGMTATVVGKALFAYLPQVLQLAGIVVIVMGLNMLGVLRIGALDRTLRMERMPRATPLGAIAMGAAFGVGWTPCIGPFLSAALLLASQEQSALQGGAVLFAYALGIGAPLVLTGAMLGSATGLARRMAPAMGALTRVGGAALVALGLLIASGQMLWLSGQLARLLGTGLTV